MTARFILNQLMAWWMFFPLSLIRCLIWGIRIVALAGMLLTTWGRKMKEEVNLINTWTMALSEKLVKKLSKTFPPKTRIDDTYKGNDITFVTNDIGEPVTLFIGKRREDGAIQGERYVRRIVRSEDGSTIVKSHWDNKGKVSRG